MVGPRRSSASKRTPLEFCGPPSLDTPPGKHNGGRVPDSGCTPGAVVLEFALVVEGKVHVGRMGDRCIIVRDVDEAATRPKWRAESLYEGRIGENVGGSGGS